VAQQLDYGLNNRQLMECAPAGIATDRLKGLTARYDGAIKGKPVSTGLLSHFPIGHF